MAVTRPQDELDVTPRGCASVKARGLDVALPVAPVLEMQHYCWKINSKVNLPKHNKKNLL